MHMMQTVYRTASRDVRVVRHRMCALAANSDPRLRGKRAQMHG